MSGLGNLYARMSFYHFARGNNPRGEKLFQKAEKYGVTAPKPILAYATYLLKNSRYEEARQRFTSIIIDKRFSEPIRLSAKQNQALVYWKLDRIDDAIDTAREVFSKRPNLAIYQTLGCLLIEGNEPLEDVLEFNQKAYDYDDEDPVVLDNLAECYLRLNQIDKAKEFFEEALKYNAYQVSSLYHLAKIYLKEGNKEKAIEHLETAIENGTFHALSTVEKTEIENFLKTI